MIPDSELMKAEADYRSSRIAADFRRAGRGGAPRWALPTRRAGRGASRGASRTSRTGRHELRSRHA